MYVLPSIIAANASTKSKPVDMGKRGLDSLTRMSDIDVVERAKRTHGGEQFEKLYINQGFDANRPVEETLDLGWELLKILPVGELKRIRQAYIDKYLKKDE